MTRAAATSLCFENATVWRGPEAEPVKSPIRVSDGVVDGFDAAPSGAADTRVDLSGLHVVPGFVDAHTHLTVGAWVPWFADGAQWESAARALAEVRTAAGVHASGWILAFNIEDDAWPDGAPTAADLEAAAPGRAVMLVHLSLHRALLSETALRRLDISRALRDPLGDVEKGRGGAPTGRVWESVFGRALTTALLDTARSTDRKSMGERVRPRTDDRAARDGAWLGCCAPRCAAQRRGRATSRRRHHRLP